MAEEKTIRQAAKAVRRMVAAAQEIVDAEKQLQREIARKRREAARGKNAGDRSIDVVQPAGRRPNPGGVSLGPSPSLAGFRIDRVGAGGRAGPGEVGHNQAGGEAMTPAEFFKLPAVLAARADLTPAAKLVFAVIVDRFGTNGRSWPGVRLIGKESALHPDTVADCVRQLERAGLLTVERQPWPKPRNVYRVAPEHVGKKPTLDVGEKPTPKKRPRRHSSGGTSEKSRQNQTKEPDQTNKEARRVATPPEQGNQGEGSGNGNGNGELIARWADGLKAHGLPFANRGKASGVLARLGKAHGGAAVLDYLRRWFGENRPDYGVELFELRANGGGLRPGAGPAGRAGRHVIPAGEVDPTTVAVAVHDFSGETP